MFESASIIRTGETPRFAAEACCPDRQGLELMPDALIENPILNSPFAAPARHFKFTDEGITNTVVDGRRSSSYFIPIARPKKKGKQLVFDTEWTQDRIEENKSVNYIRRRVGMWREGGQVGVTPTTAALLKCKDNTFSQLLLLVGEEHQYHPDFVAVLDDGRGPIDPLNLIIEVTGEKKKEKAAKVMTARTLWVPAVNNHGAFGRWGFIEIDDPSNAKTLIGASIGLANASAGDKRHA